MWQQLPALDPPTLTSVDYPGNDLAADPAGGQTILINGTNFVSGISVEIGSTEVSSVTLNSPTQLAITSPALVAGDYNVTVTNLDAGTITALDFISYNGVPSWQTAAGSLGSLSFGEAISTITLSATEPDGGNVSYAVTSGTLPAGLSLSSSGDITGTMPSGSAETTYSFTVTATDDENQSTDRAFTITGVVPFLPSKHFNTVTYTGNNDSPRVISGVGFTPDLVWIKKRTGDARVHILKDSVRGFADGKFLASNDTAAEWGSNGNFIEAVGDGTFTVNKNYNASIETNTNNSGDEYVAWNFKAGGAAVTNTDGTITSQVSANTEAGFSIVTFTGNGATTSVGHGLGQKPSIIFTKNRSVSEGWFTQQYMYVPSGNAAYGYLNTTAAFVGFTDSLTDDTVMQQGGTNGQNYVSYCFAEVEGFSSFGSYTGADNNIINTGFEPAFIMIKSTTNSAGGWNIFDNKRGTDRRLHPNLSNSESVDGPPPILNFLENGFSFNTRDSWTNGSHSYIYMAFAADPNTQVPTKADSFNTVTYTGNGTSNRAVTGVGFQPDFTWIKNRNGANNHSLYDSIRGANNLLISNSNGVNEYDPTGLQSFDSDGFSVSTANRVNQNGGTYVAWNWKAGGTPSINTDGSIPSVVSANPAAGFSIVSYTGSGANATIGHGLGIAPSMIIVKGRNTTYDWVVYNSNLTATKYLTLNTVNAENSVSNVWNDTEPTNSVFSVGSNLATNQSADPKIAYCFAEVAGFSKFGSYTGTGASGNFQDCGFEPAFVMIKRASGVEQWNMYDNKRNTNTAFVNKWIAAQDSEVEYTNNSHVISFSSTGFSFVTASTNINASGSTYIYMAFANQF